MIQYLLAAALFAVTPAGQSWPAFRGDGTSQAAVDNLPLTWSKDAGVAWTAAIPGYGQSSPVVWRDEVIVTSAIGEKKESVCVAAFSLDTGAPRWSKEFKSDQPLAMSDYVSRAAPTPAADAERVYAFFETGNLVALDHEGNSLWQRSITGDYGEFRGNHGVGSSLALTDRAVIVLVCHEGPCYLLAVDKRDGKTLWKADRAEKVSWSSPIYDSAARQIIVSSNGTCEAIDADTGKQLWIVDGLKGNTVPSATVTKELVIVGSADAGGNVAIRRDGAGDVTKTHVAWTSDAASATFSSPLVYRDHVYLVNRAGVAFCLRLATGEVAWTQRIGGSCWASPIGAGERVYFFEKTGKTTVVATGPELKILATSELPTEDRVYGVAAVDRAFVLRMGSSLTCLRAGADAAPNTAAERQP